MAFPFPADDAVGAIYLIHFSAPTTARRQHYLGWSADVNERFARHKAGCGAEETRKAVSQGIRLTLAQTWRGPRPRSGASRKSGALSEGDLHVFAHSAKSTTISPPS